MSLRSVYIIVYLGFLGLIIFVAFRSMIDLQSNSPVEMNRFAVNERASEVMNMLGLEEPGGYKPLTRRIQRTYLYTDLLDSLGKSQTLNPSSLNQSGVPLNGWSVMYLRDYDQITAIISDETLFSEFGLSSVTFDTDGRVRSYRINADNQSMLVRGDSLKHALARVFEATGHDPVFYTLIEEGALPDNHFSEPNFSQNSNDLYKATWMRSSAQARGPHRIDVTYEPRVFEQEIEGVTHFEPAIKVTRIFASYTSLDEDTIAESTVGIVDILFMYVGFLLIMILILVIGIRLIFLGEVIWRRGLVIFFVLLVLSVLYRYLSMHYLYYQVLASSMISLDMFFYLITAIALSGFVAISYMTWDAYARRQEQEQVPHIDAIWNKNLFQKKIGKAILAGYGYGGLALGLWALLLYSLDIVFYQYDGTLGFISITSLFPVLTNLINSLLYVPVVSYAFVGVMMCLLQIRIRNNYILIPLASVLVGILIGKAMPMVVTTGDILPEIIAFSFMALPLVLAYRYYGVITVAVGVWVVFMILRVGVFFGSPDPVIANQGLVIITIIMVPFFTGFLLHHYGRDDLITQNFIPEYEKRLKQQLRLEREFQIAKESQFALMPKSAPVLDNVDVKGFFVPSFDVGGDFYDHVVIKDEHGKPEELVLMVADVSGKAMKAALTAIFTSGLLLSRSRSKDKDPAAVLTDINPILHERTDNQSFITCLLARYNLKTQELRFVNAGHCQPIVKRNGKAMFLKSEDPRLPLGIRSSVPYHSTTFMLEPGDLLLLYSDGLPEARSKTGGLYEFDRILDEIEKLDTDSMDAAAICEYFKMEILNFSDYELADDMTLVVVRI